MKISYNWLKDYVELPESPSKLADHLTMIGLEVDGIAEKASGLISLLEQSPYFTNVEFTAPTTKYLQDQERFSLRMGLAK